MGETLQVLMGEWVNEGTANVVGEEKACEIGGETASKVGGECGGRSRLPSDGAACPETGESEMGDKALGSVESETNTKVSHRQVCRRSQCHLREAVAEMFV
jgi:hypothetical protein